MPGRSGGDRSKVFEFGAKEAIRRFCMGWWRLDGSEGFFRFVSEKRGGRLRREGWREGDKVLPLGGNFGKNGVEVEEKL